MNKELLSLENVSFGGRGLTPLRRVNLFVCSGEMIAVVGIRGSGKRALSSLLCGESEPDSGLLLLDGKSLCFRNSLQARKEGIFRISVDSTLIPALSIAENLFLVNEKTRSFSIVPEAFYSTNAERVLDEYGIAVDLDDSIDRIPFVTRIMLELVKCVVNGARLVIIDQVLDLKFDETSRKLMAKFTGLVDRLRQTGMAFILITNRHSVFSENARRMYVLSQGAICRTFHEGEYDPERINSFMIRQAHASYVKSPRSVGEEVFSVRHLCVSETKRMDFSVGRGEVFGLLDRSGDQGAEIIEILYGMKRSEAEIRIDSHAHRFKAPYDAFRAGMGLLSRRTVDCLFPNLDIFENITILLRNRLCYFPGLLDNRIMKVMRTDIAEQLPAFDLDGSTTNLSTEGKMDLVLQRWIFSRRKVMLFEQPELYFDFLEALRIHQAIESLRADGCAVIVISSSREELNTICDDVMHLD